MKLAAAFALLSLAAVALLPWFDADSPLSLQTTPAREMQQVAAVAEKPEDAAVGDSPSVSSPWREQRSLPSPGAVLVLSGTVSDPAGVPLSGARVALAEILDDGALCGVPLASALAGARSELTTGVDGVFSFEATFARAMRLDVLCRGWGSRSLAPVRAGNHLDVQLQPGAVVLGRITASRTGHGVEDASVSLWRDSACVGATRSGSDGSYRFEDVPAGSLLLRAVARDLAMPDPLLVTVRPGEAARADMALAAGATVVGVVLDQDDQPVYGAEVGKEQAFEHSARTDSRGEYRLQGVDISGQSEVFVRASGFAQRHAKVEGRGDSARADFVLRRTIAVQGRVVDSARLPLVHALLVFSPAATGALVASGDATWCHSGDDGRFRTELLPEQEYAMEVRHPGRAMAAAAPTVRFDGPQADLGDVVLVAGGAMMGRVLARGGSVVPASEVILTSQSGPAGEPVAPRLRRQTRTDAAGVFLFADLAPGVYEIEVRVPAGVTCVKPGIKVMAGDTSTAVELPVELGRRLSGAVQSADGSPVHWRDIEVTVEQRGRTARALIPDSMGRFEAVGLGPEDCRIRASTRRSGCEAKQSWLSGWIAGVAVGRSDLRLVVHPAIGLEGRVNDVAGRPRRGIAVVAIDRRTKEVIDRDSSGADGRFRLRLPLHDIVDLVYGQALAVSSDRLPADLANAQSFAGVGAEAGEVVLVWRAKPENE